MSISLQQAKALYTKKVIAVYDEQVAETNFLQGLFKKDTSAALDVSVEIRRNGKNIAVEVLRGGASNSNNFTKSTEKIFRPPMHSEEMVANHMDAYNIPFGMNAINPSSLGNAANETARELSVLRSKISRAKELQCAEVLFDGTVTTKYNDVIDFGRLAASKVDLGGSGGYWSVATTDVESQLIAGAEFVRNKGNSDQVRFDLISTVSQIVALKKTDYYTNDANRDTSAQLLDINRAKKMKGANYHGTIYAGAYTFDLWSYEAVYDDAKGTEQRFIADNRTVMMPMAEVKSNGLILAHGGVPVIGTNSMPIAKAGEYVLREAIDFKKVTHTWWIESAPLATVYTPDKFYTMQTLA